MKRLIASLLALPFILAFAVSCERNELEEEESVVIEGLQDAIDFAAVPTGDVTFSITSNVNWSISQKDLDWVSITPSRGLGRNEKTVVTISPDVNNDFEPRQGVFTLCAGTVSRTVTLSQAAADVEPVFNVEGTEDDTFYLEALAIDGQSFRVSSNRDWTADVNGVSWATVTPLKGEKNRSATIMVIPKTVNDDEVREGTMSFDYGAAAPKVIKLVHKKFEPTISISVTEMTAITTGKIAEPVVVVTANADWTAETSADWLAIDKAEGDLGDTEVKVSATANNTGEARTATVTFTNRTASAVLTVTQGSEYVTTSVESISTSDTEAEFDVAANVEWVVTSSQSWAVVSPSEGNGNGKVTVTLTPLTPGVTSRTAEITVAAKNIEGLSSTVTLEQKEPLQLNFIDLYETPVLFNCSQQSWNIANNVEFVSPGNTGAVEGASIGSGRAKSYSHMDNTDLYMQFIDAETDGYKEVSYIMPADGALTVKTCWTDDAFTFHIPVKKLDYGSILNFDFGLVAGGANMPVIWNTEVSFDGGKTWESFETGETKQSANNGGVGNTIIKTKQKVANRFQGRFNVQAGAQDVDMVIRIRIVDAMYVLDKNGNESAASKPAGTSIRLIGYEHPWVEKQEEPVVYGPKIYMTTDAAAFVPELSLSSELIKATGTTASFNVTSNVDWTATSSDSWATVSPAEGTGNGSVTVTMTALEPGAADRTAVITVAAKDYPGYSETIFIEQIAPAPAGPTGNYVDLTATPVLFCSNNYAWNVSNNPDYATSGENGSDTKKPDTETLFGTGKGTGFLYSYSHYDNKEVYMQFTSPGSTPAYLMAAEGNITVKNVWTDGAFNFYVPVFKLEAGKTLCFDYGVYATNKSARYWISEVSLDGGQTWAPFDTGYNYETPGLKVKANTDLGTASKVEVHINGTYAITNSVENTMIVVRFRCADGTHYMNGTTATKANTSAAVRIIGSDHDVETDSNADTVKGPKIYIK